MKKFNQKDYINILILIILFILILFSIVGFKYVNGSVVDWDSQHWIIPEYFRNLFLDTGDMFPSFAFNLGGGQNIYNLSYYGLLSPLTLLSYLLPSIPMINYVETIMILVVVTSIILMYTWLRNKFETKYAFVGTLLFLLASPIICHTHRHIMFVSYIPFLIMALMGVDKYFEKNKKTLLVISVFLIIMTSYYYSITSLLTILIYGIYKYISTKEKITFKSFIKDGFKFLFPIFIGVIMASVLTFPTLYAVLNGRADITASVDTSKLLIPLLFTDEILYTPYGLGLTNVFIYAILHNVLFKKRENKFLSIAFIMILLFPVITYLLSGFLYPRGKILIPLLPLAILLLVTFIDGITIKKNTKYLVLVVIVSSLQAIFYVGGYWYILALDIVLMLIIYLTYKNKGNKNIIIYPICLFALITCLITNYSDELVTKEDVSKQYSTYNYSKLSNLINEDENVYRVGNQILGLRNINRVADTNYYLPSMYSSVENKNYYDFTINEMNIEMPDRIPTAIFASNNIMFNTYMGMKYVVDDKTSSIGYEKIDNSNIYVNENVFPIGYATSSLMSEEYYEKLSYPDKSYALISHVIVDSDVDVDFESKIRKEDLDLEIISKDVSVEKLGDKYIVNSDDYRSLVLDLNKEFDNQILFITFDMEYSETCLIGDTSISINGVKNTLSCEEWIYENKNYNFSYVISSNDTIDKLNIGFTKGKYEISNINIHSLNYDYVKERVEHIDEFKIDKELTKGDKIVGDINVNVNGYFITTIPYDQSFTVYLDGKTIPYEKVDKGFIGFAINEGHHEIEIVYIAPYLFEGMVVSIIGYMIFIPIIYSDIRRKRSVR